jgi:hypothetical protein
MRLGAMVRKVQIWAMTLGLGVAFALPGCDSTLSDALVKGLGETAATASKGLTDTALAAIEAMFMSKTKPTSTTMGGGTVPSV